MMKLKIYRPSLFFFHVADSIRAPLRTDQSELIHSILSPKNAAEKCRKK